MAARGCVNEVVSCVQTVKIGRGNERIFPNVSSVDSAKFESHIDDVLEHLENVPLNRKKTTLSALYVLTENPQYRALMVTGINDYNQFIAKQIKTDKPNTRNE